MIPISSVLAVLFASSLVLLNSGCQASFDANISSYVNVQIPANLHVRNGNGGMPHVQARFGAHWDLAKQEGQMAMLTYSAGTLCDDDHNTTTTTSDNPPFFLMAEHGGCTPVKKARKAQTMGAAGLIIVHSHCLCSENCSFEEHCVGHLPSLNDDGSGASIQIPTMMIGKGVASHIRTIMHKNEPVLMEMAWHAPKFDHTVSLDLWYSPTHKATEAFLANFSALAHVLKDQLDFRPHHYILDGAKVGCVGHANNEDSRCYQMCTNNGRYCSVTHLGALGQDVVIESLRRMCLWKHQDSNKGVFWDYLNHFNSLCQSADFFSNKDCIKDVFKHSDINEKEIEECMADSGDIEKDDNNSLLEAAMHLSDFITQTPTVWINQLPMKWPLHTKSVFESLCMGFTTGKAPHVCSACSTCADPVACAARTPMHCNTEDGQIPEPSHSSTTNKRKGGFWKFMLTVFILTGVAGFVYYKKYMEDGNGPGLRGYSLAEALMSDDA